ncbi:hypothetical protein GE061_002277 [Apolygus lucorum]|uniref:Pyrrolo-quinoline quinone repeat domain-containing protein n=1 Tax=Apolygus lucorum TaxID=248454 RepID=A0A8S9X647_APOLU|nr:hypothetical protein GE061_002277 [Apolygus lucorum]
MINNLKDAGFPDNPDLLLALIKNEPWDKCWSMVSPKKKARSKKRKNNAKDERENKMSPTQSNNDKNSQSQTNGYVIDTNMASTSVNEATLVRQERMKDSTVTPSQAIPDRSIFSTGSKAVAEPKPSCSKSSIESRTCHEVPVLPMPSMALKGRVWPRDSPFFDEVWASKCRSILKSWSVDLQKCIDASPLGVMNNNCEDSFVIVGSHSGLVVVLKCETGEIISQTQLPDRVEASACLSSDHSFYYIGCYDGNIYRICIADGKIVWSFKTEDQVKSTCVLHLEKIFVGSYDEHIYALSEGGDLFWKQHVGPVTIPVLPFQSSIIVGTLTNKVLRLSTKDGSVLSKIEISFPLFSNLILTTYRGHRRCVLMAPVDGPMLWCTAETLTQVEELVIQGSKFSSPVVSDQLTIIASGRTIHCLQFLKTIWTYEFHERIVSTPFTVGARLVVITIDGSLHLLDDSGTLRELDFFRSTYYGVTTMENINERQIFEEVVRREKRFKRGLSISFITEAQQMKDEVNAIASEFCLRMDALSSKYLKYIDNYKTTGRATVPEDMKRYIRDRNTTVDLSIKRLQELTHEAMNSVIHSHWKSFNDHIVKLEHEFWTNEGVQEEASLDG